MRKKSFRMAWMVLVVAIAYIVLSTTCINEGRYLKRAWLEAGQSKHILNWQEGEVTVISLRDKAIKQVFIPKPTASAKINRKLLWMNGNKAVRVLFHTDNEGMLGPTTVYFNPITKQVIGYDVNE